MNKKKKKAVKVCINMDQSIWSMVQDYCEDTGITRTKIVEKAVKTYLTQKKETDM